MGEYDTALKFAVESLEDEVGGYERYKWLLTTEIVKKEPELGNIIADAMNAERTHADAFVNWIKSKLQ